MLVSVGILMKCIIGTDITFERWLLFMRLGSGISRSQRSFRYSGPALLIIRLSGRPVVRPSECPGSRRLLPI